VADLFTELKRRNVFRVGVAYAIVGWLLVEVASVFLPALRLPEWTLTFLVFLVVVGFPIALIFAWAFELTPEGFKRETAVDRSQSIANHTGRKLDFIIIGVLAVGIVYFAVDKFVFQPEPEQAEVAAEQVPAAEPVEREKSVAVLLFDNLSRDAANEPFTIGIHDDILTQISKIRALKVIARTSMERLDPTLSIPEIGTQLGVATVLEGGVQRAGDRVRINVQLIDCETEAHLWAETYDRELTAANIFSIQTEIATAIADALRATLTPEEQKLIDTVPTENMAALEAYFLGKQRFANLTTGSMAEAVVYFKRAIELDPNFALAHVELADSYITQILLFGFPNTEMIAKAEPLVERALELDDRSGEAHTERGRIQVLRGELESAEAAFQRALELNPNHAGAYGAYAFLLRDMFGRAEEALALNREAVALDPLSANAIFDVGQSLDALGRFDEGLSWYKKSLKADPGFPSTLWSIGLHHWLISREYGEAVKWLRKAISADPGDAYSPAHLGRLFMDLGDLDRAEYWIHRSIELNPESFVANQAKCLLHFYGNDQATGLEYGRRALAVTTSWALQVLPVQLIGNHELRAGRTSEARALYKKSNPELLGKDAPRVNNWNYRVAIDLALVLSTTGEQDRADLLLDLVSQHIQTLPRLSSYGYGIADVRIYALRGDEQKALSTLRQAIDEGWRSLWWYLLKHDPSLESLHDDPEFQAMVAEIEADMAAQLARVREMERNGELEPIPEMAAE
jgi:TolB-like protein/Tfp pilus assembly protein PilF